jgi:hypothetical protein
MHLDRYNNHVPNPFVNYFDRMTNVKALWAAKYSMELKIPQLLQMGNVKRLTLEGWLSTPLWDRTYEWRGLESLAFTNTTPEPLSNSPVKFKHLRSLNGVSKTHNF